jgi:hypothetical protein
MKKKETLKIALVIDDYKLPNKDQLWKDSLDKAPNIEKEYQLDKEEIKLGPTPTTLSIIRYYKLKGK